MPRKKARIVLDANVLYAGLYSSRGVSFQVLKAIGEGKIEMVVSTTLLFEYEDVLKRNQEALVLSDREIDSILDNFCLMGEHHKIYFLWRPYLADPKDDHLLELAIASGTRRIVTFNKKDFKGSEKFGVKIISPKEIWEEIS